MRQGARAGIAAAIAMVATGLSAQPTPAAAGGHSADDYLCVFAGKCGGATANDPDPTIAAPATKGFRLAAPQAGAGQPASSSAAPTHAMSATAPAHGMATTSRHPAATRAAALDRPATRPVQAGAHANLMLTFAKGSDRMTSSAITHAQAFAAALKMPELEGKRFLIEGHTDARGVPAKNMDLSQRRAQAVVNYLVDQGVDRSRLQASGVGSDKPLSGVPGSAPANRRVEAVLLS